MEVRMDFVICPRRDGRKVAVKVCLEKCKEEVRALCEEYKEIPKADIGALAGKLKMSLPELTLQESISDQNPEGVGVADNPGTERKVQAAPIDEEAEAKELYNSALTLKKQIELRWFDLAKVLQRIFEKKYYLKYSPTWPEFCSTHLDFQWRYADYLRSTREKCDEVGIDSETASEIGIGKLRELTPVLTKASKSKWLTEAKKEGMTVEKLNLKVRLARGKITKEEAQNAPATMIFRPYKDQVENIERGIALAMNVSGSTSRTNALEIMSSEFRAGWEAEEPEVPKAKIVKLWIERVEALLKIKVGEIIDLESGQKILHE